MTARISYASKHGADVEEREIADLAALYALLVEVGKCVVSILAGDTGDIVDILVYDDYIE